MRHNAPKSKREVGSANGTISILARIEQFLDALWLERNLAEKIH